MKELILEALKTAVITYPDLLDYLKGDAAVAGAIWTHKAGEAPDDKRRVKDENKLAGILAVYFEGLQERIIKEVKRAYKDFQPGFWDDEQRQLWMALSDEFTGIIIHGIQGGIDLLEKGKPVDKEAVVLAALENLRQYRGEWMGKLTKTVRDFLEKAIADWQVSGDPLSELIKTLSNKETGMFSKERAKRIAVTEVTRLYARGNKLAWEKSGYIREFMWHTAMDDLVCATCKPRDGKLFPIADMDNLLPAHVNCRCWGTPVVDTELLRQSYEW